MDESGRVGLQGTFELTRDGAVQEFNVGWAGSGEFWLRSQGWTVVAWDRTGWIERDGSYERFRHSPDSGEVPGVGDPVAGLLEVSPATRLEIVRTGTAVAGTNQVRFNHNHASGVLDLALGVITDLDCPEFSFHSRLTIADIAPPPPPWAHQAATFTGAGMPKPLSGRWEGYLGIDLDGGAPEIPPEPNTAFELPWAEVTAAAHSGRLELHALSEASVDLWDLVGAVEMLPKGLDLDRALEWFHHRGCHHVDIVVNHPHGSTEFEWVDGHITGPAI